MVTLPDQGGEGGQDPSVHAWIAVWQRCHHITPQPPNRLKTEIKILTCDLWWFAVKHELIVILGHPLVYLKFFLHHQLFWCGKVDFYLPHLQDLAMAARAVL